MQKSLAHQCNRLGLHVIDDSVITAVSVAGCRNFVYGAVTPAEHHRCSSPMTGLITDYPLLLKAAGLEFPFSLSTRARPASRAIVFDSRRLIKALAQKEFARSSRNPGG